MWIANWATDEDLEALRTDANELYDSTADLANPNGVLISEPSDELVKKVQEMAREDWAAYHDIEEDGGLQLRWELENEYGTAEYKAYEYTARRVGEEGTYGSLVIRKGFVVTL